MAQTRKLLSQKSNYAGDFGHVYRSSAIFYYERTRSLKTTLSFMNYWRFKRNISVMILASTRDMEGKLVHRERLTFDSGLVRNYSPFADDGQDFYGSVEIEVFAGNDMVIPYSAIMAVYEAPKSISMVHSYGRVYSPQEVEEGRTVMDGEESCWTIRDTDEISSFCAFHNGYDSQPAQSFTVRVVKSDGETLSGDSTLATLSPYSTVVVRPKQILAGLVDFLEGEPANTSVSFQLKNAFTRMLIGNRMDDGSECQVSHSNFNFSRHKTDAVSTKSAFMVIPEVPLREPQLVIYPDMDQGQYNVSNLRETVPFEDGDYVSLDVEPGSVIAFNALQGPMPSRIVTGLMAKPSMPQAQLPFECSLGVIHQERPPKSSNWGLVACTKDLRSRTIITDLASVYGGYAGEETSFRLFSEIFDEPKEVAVDRDVIEQLLRGTYVDELFDEAEQFLGSRFGYVYLRSYYGGFVCYTTIENDKGSLTIEHTF